MKLSFAELLEPTPAPLWRLVKQIGVDHVVSLLGEQAEQKWRWPSDEGSQVWVPKQYIAPPKGQRPWEKPALARLQKRYLDHGLTLSVIEDTAPMDAIRLGTCGRDETIEWFCTQLRAMGELGIGTLCYNWVAIASWARTSAAVELRGGALSSAYNDAIMNRAPALIEPGSVTHEQLWNAFEYFLNAVVPVAEASGVRISLHPDDPPIPFVRGIPRIMGTPEAFERVLATVPSRYSGITFCQGNFTLMTDDLPSLIRQLGRDGRIFFAHFRDVVGTRGNFFEVFHDEGPTDMLECMRAYREIDFDGVLRPDHVPALEGDSNESFGYSNLGRLFAIGYMTGLREAVLKEANEFELGQYKETRRFL
jgi:mannonate dehydratase